MFVTTIVVVSIILYKYGNPEVFIISLAIANVIFFYIALIYHYNKSMDKFKQEIEEKAKSDFKFKACFNNLRESIILISNEQIEYVNSSFLELFVTQIKLSNQDSSMLNAEEKKPTLFVKLKALFKKADKK